MASFDIKVSNVYSTKAKVVIEPSSPDAYYCFGFINNADLATYYAKSDLENALFQIDFLKERWALVCQDEGRTVPYADLFCYRGRHEIDYTYLTPDTDHRIIVFQINPDTQELIGNPVSKVFHTRPLVMSDITFTIGFDADLLTITPSNRDGYCWAYQLTKDILENYADTEHRFQYFTIAVSMFYSHFCFFLLSILNFLHLIIFIIQGVQFPFGVQFSIYLVAIGAGIEAVGADGLLGKTDSLANILDGIELESIDTNVLTDYLNHVGILLAFGILIKGELFFRQLGSWGALEFLDDAAGDELPVSLRLTEVEESASVDQWRTGDTDVHFLGTVVIEHLHIVAQLGTTDNGVVAEDHLLTFEHGTAGDELHFCHEETVGL